MGRNSLSGLAVSGKCIGEHRQFLYESIVRAAKLPDGCLKGCQGLGRKARSPSTVLDNPFGLVLGCSDNSSGFNFGVGDDPLSKFVPLDHSPSQRTPEPS